MSERVTYRDKTVPWTVSVVDVERFGDVFVRISCSLPQNASLVPGDTIGVDVSPPTQALRRYTVSRVSDQTFEFVAFRTQRGPATPYVDRISVGDELHGQGPERPVKLPTGEMTNVVVLGDETVIGTAVAIIGATSCPVSVAVKTSSSLERIGPTMGAANFVTCTTEEEIKSWLSDFLQQHDLGSCGVFLVGEQSANQSLRQHAFSLGLAKDQLATRTFWRPDKAGLE